MKGSSGVVRGDSFGHRIWNQRRTRMKATVTPPTVTVTTSTTSRIIVSSSTAAAGIRTTAIGHFSEFKRPLPPKLLKVVRRPLTASSADNTGTVKTTKALDEPQTLKHETVGTLGQIGNAGKSIGSSTSNAIGIRSRYLQSALHHRSSIGDRANGRPNTVVGTPRSEMTFKSKIRSSAVVTRDSLRPPTAPADPYSELQNLPGIIFTGDGDKNRIPTARATFTRTPLPPVTPRQHSTKGSAAINLPTTSYQKIRKVSLASPKSTKSVLSKVSSILPHYRAGSSIIRGLKVNRGKTAGEDNSSSGHSGSVSDPEITRRYSIKDLVEIISGEKPIPESGMFIRGPLYQRYLAEERARETQIEKEKGVRLHDFGTPRQNEIPWQNTSVTSEYFGEDVHVHERNSLFFEDAHHQRRRMQAEESNSLFYFDENLHNQPGTFPLFEETRPFAMATYDSEAYHNQTFF